MQASALRLRPPVERDETEFVAAHRALARENVAFGIGFGPEAPFADFVESVTDSRHGRNLPEGWVPGTFLVGVVDGSIVGRVSVRHALNDYLHMFIGHVGFAVISEFRCRGYATEMLRQALVIARAQGVDRVLLTCDEDNVASARTIERNGGVLENRVDLPDGGTKRRYWID
jgi:predicted acetyltransferase